MPDMVIVCYFFFFVTFFAVFFGAAGLRLVAPRMFFAMIGIY
jgi:hypothetical protein